MFYLSDALDHRGNEAIAGELLSRGRDRESLLSDGVARLRADRNEFDFAAFYSATDGVVEKPQQVLGNFRTRERNEADLAAAKIIENRRIRFHRVDLVVDHDLFDDFSDTTQ